MQRDTIREAEIVEEFGRDWRGRFAEMACCVADPDESIEGGGDEEEVLVPDDEDLPETLREPETQPERREQLLREPESQDS